MDTSEQYIKMCDCPEIQDKSPCHYSYADNRTLFSSTDKVDIDGYRKGSFKVDSEYNFFIGGWWCGKVSHLWLPRQDQIQEMLLKEKGLPKMLISPSTLINLFFDWYSAEAGIGEFRTLDTSMEKWWLAFYMHEKHQLIWENEKWIKK